MEKHTAFILLLLIFITLCILFTGTQVYAMCWHITIIQHSASQTPKDYIFGKNANSYMSYSPY